MARKRFQVETPLPDEVLPVLATQGKRIPVEAAEVVTVDEKLDNRRPESFQQSIVRLKPSAVAEAHEVKDAATDLRDNALALKVLPRPPANRLVLSAGNTGVTQLPTNTRALVLGTVDPGKTALLQYLSELCDKEGL